MKRIHFALARSVALIGLAVGLGVASPAFAQSGAGAVTSGFELPDPSVTTSDDLTSTEVNPAGLGLVEGGEFAYGLGLRAPARDVALVDEHAVMGAGGTGNFGAGFALQWLERDIGGRTIQYHKHSLGLGFKPASLMSFGTSLHFFGSPDSIAVDELTTWDLGLQFRPTEYLGFGMAARGINQPFVAFESVPLRLRPGLVLRLFEGRVVLDGELDWTPRTGATTVHPRINVEPVRGLEVFARAGMPLGDDVDTVNETSVSAGISMNLGYAGVRSGVTVDDAADDARLARQSHLIRATSQRESSVVPYGRRWVRVPIDDSIAERSQQPLFGPSTHSLLNVVTTIDEMSRDPEIDGVVLDIRPNDLGYAQMWELRQALARFKASGKKVVALLQSPDTPNVYLAAAAQRTWLIPAEPYEPTGLSTNRVYYAKLLSNIGVRAEFVRIGDYKSAPESFIRKSPSDAELQQTNAYLDDIYATIIDGIAESVGKAKQTVREMINSVPLLPDAAIEQGYVDDVIYPDELRSQLERTYGPIASIDEQYVAASTGNEHWGSALEVAVIHIDGSIVRGRSGSAPLIGESVTGHETIRNVVDQLLVAPDVAAAVIRIDSPGGSAVASDLIYREIRRLATEMPVVASMGDVAASGGYYVAAGADHIYATPNTLTGSIGIFAGKFSIENLAQWAGVNTKQLQRGETAGKYSVFRPWTETERESVITSMNYLYQLFLQQVARTRPLKADRIDELARGRVWSGKAAAEKKLVDHIGSLTDAIHRAEKLAGLESGQARYRMYPSQSGFPEVVGGVTSKISDLVERGTAETSTRSAGERLLERISEAALLPLLYGQKEPLMLPYAPIRLEAHH